MISTKSKLAICGIIAAIFIIGTITPMLLSENASATSTGMATQWINHLAFLAGDPSTTTSFNAINSGVGSGLSGLIITSSNTGDTAPGGGNKVIETALQLPPFENATAVIVCYESTSNSTFIENARISQVQIPPSTANVLLDAPLGPIKGPTCVGTHTAPFSTITPAKGPLLLDLRLNFASTSDTIVLRGVAVVASPMTSPAG